MSLSPIPRVLFTFRRHKVRALLMGGQACILYGASEFTRDVDFVAAVDPVNLKRVGRALRELQAEPVYFPPLSPAVLKRGHACHFKALAPGLHGLRIDLMSRMRGVEPFAALWKRRVEIDLPGVGLLPVLSLPDLLKAKKTQRDKDWPMIRRLIEADMARESPDTDAARIRFWLRECRTFELLRDLARRHPGPARRVAAQRPALRAALKSDAPGTATLLRREEDVQREKDRRYWAPLRAELEQWRLGRKG